jgi:tetratricopeptide (TPR) repeat protein
MASAANATSVLELAQRLLDAGQYEQAIAPLHEATRLAPNNPAVFANLGQACLLTRRIPQAITCLRRAIALAPSVARPHYNLGLALQQAGDDPGALTAYRRAIARDPTMAEAHVRLADLLWQRGRRREAAAAYEQASRASPDTTFGRLAGAKAMTVLDRPKEAEERLRKLIARDPSCTEAHLVLAHVLQGSGRFDDAAASYERALALAPGQATAYQGLVSSRRLTATDRPLLARILARLDAPDVPERQRMTLHFAAGKAHDDLGDYASAMEHFDAANRIRRKVASPFDRKEHERVIDRLIARYTREFFEEHAAMGQPDETPILVLGMPRSGSTLIERILSSHPKVGGGGELAFWNQNGAALVHADAGKLGEAAPRLRGDYLGLLHDIAPDAIRVTDKMPANRFWVGLVHLVLRKARFVHCRRDPIDTCLSIYATQFSESWGFACDKGDLAACYREYVRLMDHWRAVLPPDRWLDVDYEDVTRAPDDAARRLVAFAGLAWDAVCLAPEENPDVVKTASKWQARQPVYKSSVERWRHYEPWLGELLALVPGR